MLLLIKIAFGGLEVTIQQRVEPLPPARRVVETTGVEVPASADRPGLAKTRPALRVVREVA